MGREPEGLNLCNAIPQMGCLCGMAFLIKNMEILYESSSWKLQGTSWHIEFVRKAEKMILSVIKKQVWPL